MKELKPITRTRFQCGFCKKITVRKENCIQHERVCYYNPNRECDMCGGLGVSTINRDGDSETCPACKIAMECRDKSYIENQP